MPQVSAIPKGYAGFFWFGAGVRFDFNVGPDLPAELREICFCGGAQSTTVMAAPEAYMLDVHIAEKFKTHRPSKAYGFHLEQKYGVKEY